MQKFITENPLEYYKTNNSCIFLHFTFNIKNKRKTFIFKFLLTKEKLLRKLTLTTFQICFLFPSANKENYEIFFRFSFKISIDSYDHL